MLIVELPLKQTEKHNIKYRTCPCNGRQVQDVSQVLTTCPTYDDIRNELGFNNYAFRDFSNHERIYDSCKFFNSILDDM